MSDLDALFEPLMIGDVRLPNRVMTSAMTLQYGRDGLLTDRHLAYYEERARGGVGLLFSEQMAATRRSDSPYAAALRAWEPRQSAEYRRLAAALRPHGTPFFVQLFAAGAAGASTVGIGEWSPVRGPSRVAAPGGELPLPLDRDELKWIAADFGEAAQRVVDSGLHGVEIHGSHGWLVGQFLSPYYNRRHDGYGGSVERRCRFALEIGQATRTRIGRHVPLGLALSYDELMGDLGITPEDTLRQIEVFEESGYFDFYDLSVGSTHFEHHTLAPMSTPHGHALAFGARAKRVVRRGAAVLVAGRIVDPAMAARAIADGQADIVGMSRAHLADPQLVRKARERRVGSIRRCVGMNACVRRALADQPVTCGLNPRTGRELEWPATHRARAARQIVVVGAGPAGLHFAVKAAESGHEVTVRERSGEAGGHLAALARLPGRGEWSIAIRDWERALSDAGGRLELACNVAPGHWLEGSDELVVVATGAHWDARGTWPSRFERSSLPGADQANVMPLDVAIERSTTTGNGGLGRRVLIVDGTGTYAPLGLADLLTAGGTEVLFVTPNESVGRIAAGEQGLQHLMPVLYERAFSLRCLHDLETVEGRTAILRSVFGGRPHVERAVDTVVLALTRVPRDGLYHELRRQGRDVRCIGDAVSPRPLEAVVHEAEALAREL
jgi:2,4-dienoyl-CoA reductase-like NADH-dependent reductase (Old Yellow Enzyme family)